MLKNHFNQTADCNENFIKRNLFSIACISRKRFPYFPLHRTRWDRFKCLHRLIFINFKFSASAGLLKSCFFMAWNWIMNFRQFRCRYLKPFILFCTNCFINIMSCFEAFASGRIRLFWYCETGRVGSCFESWLTFA